MDNGIEHRGAPLTDAQLMERVSRVVNHNPLGMLCTVDQECKPAARFMECIAHDGVRMLYCLSGHAARKTQHLLAHPDVSWVFSDHELQHVVTLVGRAEVDDDPCMVQMVWEHIMRMGNKYPMSMLRNDDHLRFVAIRTFVSQVELLSPQLGLYKPVTMEVTHPVQTAW